MLGDALSTLNAQFAYRLMNLCVKAEPVSLLPRSLKLVHR